MKRLLLLFALILLSLNASAINITVTEKSCGGSQVICDSLKRQIENDLQEDLPDVSLSKYADGIANANGFASRGQASDYAENFSWFVIKPSFGVAVAGDLDKMQDEPESAEGIGLSGGLTLGLNLNLLPVDKLGPIDLTKLDVFLTLFSHQIDQEIGDDTQGEGDISSFAFMARYKLMDTVDLFPGYMLQWGGIHLHTGLQRSSMKIDLTQNLKDEVVTDDSTNSSGTFSDGQVGLGIDSTSTTIPIEVSTYLRFLYAFTIYGGAGFDYVVNSSSDVDIDASGNFSGSGPGTSFEAEINANESESGSGTATNMRAFLGFQINVPFVRIYVQANKALGEDLVGANAGIKIAY